MMQNNEKNEPTKSSHIQNRWFALALVFLGLNTWAVLRDKPQGEAHDSEATAGQPAKYSLVGVSPRPDSSLNERDLIRWSFSSPVIAREATHAWQESGPFAFVPPQEGMFCWESPTDLVFRPREKWPVAQSIRSRPVGTLRDPDKKPVRLSSNHFNTTPLKMVGVGFYEKPNQLRFRFNAEVHPEQLAKHLTIRADNATETLAIDANSSEPTNNPVLTIAKISANKLHLEISQKLRPAQGDIGLKKPVTHTLRSPQSLYLRGTTEKMYSFGKGDIYLKFSSKVLPGKLRGYLEIQPEIPFRILSTDNWWRGHCRIHADFKPSTTYRLMLHKGIQPVKGLPNAVPFTRSIQMPSRPADVTFLHRGSHLSPHGNLHLPIHSVNLDQMKVSVSRIYPRNLVIFGMRNEDKYHGYYGHAHKGLSIPVVRKQTWPILEQPEQTVETRLELRQILEPPYTGIYHVDIEGERYSQSDRKILHVTDIGISLQRSDREILVWANSLTSLKPIKNATVTFYSEANQILAVGQTSEEGIAQMPIPENPTDPPFLVTVGNDVDLASLFLGKTIIDNPTSHEGRAYLGDQAEAFVFPDRGIYRPGETTHVKAIVRNAHADITEPFPVELQVRRPDGREGRRFHGMLSRTGTVSFDITWPRTNPLGKYTFQLTIPGNNENPTILGTCKASLEEFTAAKLEVEVQADTGAINPDETLHFKTSARHLFGRPADNLPVTAHIRYRPRTFKHPDWTDYKFRDDEKAFPAEHEQLKKIGMGKLDQDGLAAFQTGIASLQPASSAEILLIATVADVAGRPVSGSTTRRINPYPFHVGIRSMNEPGIWEAAAITPEGKPAPDDTILQFTVSEVTRSLLLVKDNDGNYRYHSERHLTPVKESGAQTINGCAMFNLEQDLPAGHYIVQAKHPGGGASATMDWTKQDPDGHARAWASEEPEKVELTFDQPHYMPGQTARLDIAAPFPGRALVTLQQDSILETRILDLSEEGTGHLTFTAGREHFPNAWATVSVIRRIVSGEPQWKPHRAFSRAALKVSPESRRLRLQIDIPPNVRPAETFTTNLRVTDADGAPANAELSLALVDEGILSLTAFNTPKPLEYFHAARRPSFHLHDPYGLLLPENDGTQVLQKLAVGSGAQPALGKFLNPFTARRFKNLALWKPAVQTGPDGHAEIRWELPEFTGKIRLMAVAVDGKKFGSTEDFIVVKRPFTVASGLPRFLAPGDRFTMPVRIYNDSPKDAEFELSIKTSGNLSIHGHADEPVPGTTATPSGDVSTRHPLTVKAGEYIETATQVHTAQTPGIAWVDITVKALGETYHERIELAIRPAYARKAKIHAGVLIKGESIDLPTGQGFLAGTLAGQLETSPAPDALLGPTLESLLRYPYGCLEQTTSGSLPLLYSKDMVQRTNPNLLQPGEVRNYVQAGIRRVLSMQNSQGAFGWWPGSRDSYHWGTVYATQFLLEAKKAGFSVPQADLDRALNWIQKKLNNSTKKMPKDLQTFSLQALAQAGRLPAGWLQRFWEERDKLSIESRIRLATAFIHSGNRRKAQELAADIVVPTFRKNKIQSWETLGSPLRTQALLLGLYVELDPASAPSARLATKLQPALEKSGYWTTQENAMILLAMGKYARHLGNSSLETTAGIIINGETMENHSPQQDFHFPEGKTPREIRLVNNGPGPLYYSFTLDGIPMTPPESRASGIRIARTLLDEDGLPIGDRVVRRGETLRVELAINTLGNALDHLAIRDLLPAGLEIEASGADDNIRHKEHRDDRFLLFPNAILGERKFHYLAKAVTAGKYTLPAPTATCMYDAEVQSIGQHGTLTIEE